MILFSELSRRRIRSVSSLIKVGRIEPVMVLRVDKEKGYIDISKRRVSEEDIQGCEERYNKSKLVHSIMRHVAETMQIDLEIRPRTEENVNVSSSLGICQTATAIRARRLDYHTNRGTAKRYFNLKILEVLKLWSPERQLIYSGLMSKRG